MAPRKIYFKTLGCRLNQAEVGSFSRLFLDGGWCISEEDPDAVVLHSCAVTRAAERETFRYIRVLRREYPSAVIAVTGCAVACNPENLFLEAGADLVVAVKDVPRLPEMLSPEFRAQSPESRAQSPESIAQSPESGVQSLGKHTLSEDGRACRPATVADAEFRVQGSEFSVSESGARSPEPRGQSSGKHTLSEDGRACRPATADPEENSALRTQNSALTSPPLSPSLCTSNDIHFPVQMPFFSTKRALLKVQDGCSFKCAYCVVPLTRGPSISRNWASSIDSAQRLLDAGFKEIVVTGCNLACYRNEGRGLPELTDALCGLAEQYGARIRLGSVEPGICDEGILSVMRSRENLCRFLHYPIQSGDPDILKTMGRLYTAEYITELLSRLRAEFPLLGLGADFITGLPGEDEKAFERTCAVVCDFEFANIHVFPYSPRQGTKAPGFKNCPSRTVAKQRAEELRRVADEAGMAYRKRLVGHKTEVLVEGFGKDGFAYGWNGEYVQCRFSAPNAKIAGISSFTPTAVSPDGDLRS